MDEYENSYDEQTGRWTTAGDRYWALMRSRPEYARLDELIQDDPEAAWTTLLELAGEVVMADGQMFDHVGAGPVENFVRRHGERYVGRIEAAAAADPRFRCCLAHIWLSEGRLPPDVTDRLVRATGGAIPVIPRRASGAGEPPGPPAGSTRK